MACRRLLLHVSKLWMTQKKYIWLKFSDLLLVMLHSKLISGSCDTLTVTAGHALFVYNQTGRHPFSLFRVLLTLTVKTCLHVTYKPDELVIHNNVTLPVGCISLSVNDEMQVK